MALIHDLPNELILLISAHFSASDLYHIVLISRRFSFLLPALHRLALGQSCAKSTLFWAVLSGNRDLARHMLEKGEKKIAVLRDTSYILPGECDEESFDWIMRQRSNLALVDCYYRFSPRPPSLALGWAVYSRRHALLRLALSTSDITNPSLCSEAFFHAAWARDGTAVKMMRERIDGSTPGGQKSGDFLNLALFKAVKECSYVISSLLAQGADVNARDPDGTPVIVSAVKYSCDAAETLLKYGADINARDKEGKLAITVAEECDEPWNPRTSIIEQLRAKMLEANSRNSGGPGSEEGLEKMI